MYLLFFLNWNFHIKTSTSQAILKHGAMLRGDLATIMIGKYSIIGENTVLRPPHKRFKGYRTICSISVSFSLSLSLSSSPKQK